jgi:hypothetical protein
MILVFVPSAAGDIKAEYMEILENDLKTINGFFKVKLDELKARFETLRNVTKRPDVR